MPYDARVWQYQSIFRFYRLYRNRRRWLLRLIVWVATWPKVMYLAVCGRNHPRRRRLLRAFWQVLWMS